MKQGSANTGEDLRPASTNAAGSFDFRETLLLVAIWFALHGLSFLSTPVYAPSDTFGYEEVAGVLFGRQDFPAAGLHFPPGYGALIGVGQAIFGSLSPYAIVLGQHFCVLVTALILLDLGRFARQPRIGLFAAGMTIGSPMLMGWSQTLYTEIVTSWLLVIAVWAAIRAPRARRSYTWAILTSVAIAMAGLTRQVPYALAVPVAAYWFLQRRQFSGAARFVIPCLPLAVCAVAFLGWCSFTLSQTGHFEHSSGGGRHLYNRVVFTDKTLAVESPQTARLLSLLSKEEALEAHWTVFVLLQERGLTGDEANRLMTGVSLESIRYAPVNYAFNTARLFARYWFIEPVVLTNAVRSEAPMPRMATPFKPIATLLAYLTGHWVIGWLALWGMLATGSAKELDGVRLAAIVTAVYLAAHAAAEWESSRFGIPVYPLLAYLAGWGLLVGGRRIVCPAAAGRQGELA